MAIHLIVLRPFLHFSKGDIVDDPEQIRTILASEQRKFVVKIGSTLGEG